MSQIYAKDSFDRFGDDLCQHLLSYLSFGERFRRECLSTQWQRVVYNTQTSITFDKQLTAYLTTTTTTDTINTIDTIVKKCHKSAKSLIIYFYTPAIYTAIIDAIVKYCNELTEVRVTCDTCPTNVISQHLYTKYGQQLRTIGYDFPVSRGNDLSIRRNIAHCPNIERLYYTIPYHQCPRIRALYPLSRHYQSLLFGQLFCGGVGDTDEGVAQGLHYARLHTIRTYFERDSMAHTPNLTLNNFDTFIANYSLNIKVFDVTIGAMITPTEVTRIMTGVSHMTQLRSLSVTYSNIDLKDNHFRNQWELIERKCRRLKRVSIKANRLMAKQFNAFIDIINDKLCGRVKGVDIRVPFGKRMASAEQMLFNTCAKHVTHVRLDFGTDWVISDQFLVNLCDSLPAIQMLELSSRVEVTKRSLKGLTQLPRLQNIRLVVNKDIEELVYHTLRDKCPKVATVCVNKLN